LLLFVKMIWSQGAIKLTFHVVSNGLLAPFMGIFLLILA
jgi:hypothetical protein